MPVVSRDGFFPGRWTARATVYIHDQTMVDVTDHELVPEHTVLDEEAVDEVLEEYNVRRTDLPKIKYNPSKRSEQDPALRALDQDVEPGDVVRIERDSRTAADTAVVYRLVVE